MTNDRRAAVLGSELDEPVHLDEPGRAWADHFAAERARIERVVTFPLEHIGSTAVPGLLAKPIIDIQLGVPVHPPADETLLPCTSSGTRI